jgi:hypothetical protein
VKIVKSRKEILTDFMKTIGEYSNCFFKLTNGKDCLGVIELIDNNFLQFSSDYTNLENYDYEVHCTDDFILIPLRDIDLNHLYYWSRETYCFINLQWSVDQESWIHNETKPGSIPFSQYFSDLIEDNKHLKEVGYWQSDQGSPYLPHPKYLVESGWRTSERSMIVAYLKSGHECGYWCGYSYCRFDCFSQRLNKNVNELPTHERMDGIRSMGCRDLTDGEWVWPEGLAHYVEKHDIGLPNAFIETMQKNSWLVSAKVDFRHRFEVGVSSSYWVHWAIEHVKSKHK